jgi:hypothetical protein
MAFQMQIMPISLKEKADDKKKYITSLAGLFGMNDLMKTYDNLLNFQTSSEG